MRVQPYDLKLGGISLFNLIILYLMVKLITAVQLMQNLQSVLPTFSDQYAILSPERLYILFSTLLFAQ